MLARLIFFTLLLLGSYLLLSAWSVAERPVPQVLKQVAEKVMQQQSQGGFPGMPEDQAVSRTAI